MTRTQVLQEIRRMRFAEAYGGWQERRLSQEEAARLLGVCERTFRRYVDRYEDEGLDGLVDKRLGQVSARRAPVDEVVRTEALYRERYDGWNVKHFHSFYRREHAGTRSYTWVKNTLQRAGLVAKAPARGRHRRRRERAPVPGMELPRFRGPLTIVQRRCPDGRKTSPLRAGVPAPDGGVGAGRSHARGAGSGVRVLGAGGAQLGASGGPR